MKYNCWYILPFKMITTALMLMSLTLISSQVSASDYLIDVNYTWSEPQDGSSIVHYVVQHSINGGAYTPIAEVPAGSYRVPVALDSHHQIRVAGVDALNRQGPWSESSEVYNPKLMLNPPPGYHNGYLGEITINEGHPIITGQAYLDSIQVVECYPGGDLGGDIHLLVAKLIWSARGVNELTGFSRQVSIPLSGEIHTAPRNVDDPEQSFAMKIFRLHGSLNGDVDFEQFTISIGSNFDLDSSGYTNLMELSDGSFLIDSYFNLNYQIEYLADNESSIAGIGGVTQGMDYFKAPESRDMSDVVGSKIPTTVALFQNSPNPFNPQTIIRYELPMESSHVALDIFDIRGNHILKLVDKPELKGMKSATWNGTNSRGQNVPAGVYLYKLKTSQGTLIRKMTLVK